LSTIDIIRGLKDKHYEEVEGLKRRIEELTGADDAMCRTQTKTEDALKLAVTSDAWRLSIMEAETVEDIRDQMTIVQMKVLMVGSERLRALVAVSNDLKTREFHAQAVKNATVNVKRVAKMMDTEAGRAEIAELAKRLGIDLSKPKRDRSGGGK
jgi:hypothetical protein